MLRVLSRSWLILTLAAFAVPTVSSDAEAGKRHFSKKGNSWSSVGRSRHHRHSAGFIWHIPAKYLNGGDNGYEKRYYRGGPKIINVQKELRRQRLRKYRD